MLDMKIIRDPLFPQRKVSQTLFGRSAITGIMTMDQATPPIVTPTQPTTPPVTNPPVTTPPVTEPETPPVTPPPPVTEPVTPVEPAQPTTPTTPTTPPVTEPEQPTTPANPTTPTEPEQPTTPTPTPQPPVITTQPQAARTVVGADFSLTVAADGANTYKWQRLLNGVWTDISGARSKTYTVSAAASADAGDYRAIASGTGGSTASASAAVKVDTAYVAIGKSVLLGIDLNSAPFTKTGNGTQILSLSLKTGAIVAAVGKFLTSLVGTVLALITGGTTTLRWVVDDPTIVTVSAGLLGTINIKPLKTGKTYLRLYADGAGNTPDGMGIIEINVIA